MNIKYRIIEVHPAEHSFVVRYYTELITEEMLCSQFVDAECKEPVLGEDGKPVRCRTDYNLTMFNEEATEEELDKLIQQNAPVDWLKIQERNLGRTTDTMTPVIGRALAKKGLEHEFTDAPPPVFEKPSEELTDEQIDAMLTKFVKTNAK